MAAYSPRSEYQPLLGSSDPPTDPTPDQSSTPLPPSSPPGPIHQLTINTTVNQNDDQDYNSDSSSSPSSPPRSLKPSIARSTQSYGSTIDPDSASATVPYRRRRARQVGPTRLRSKLLCALVTVLLGICIYGSFVDDFMGTVEDGISCGFCLGLLMPLQALAHVGDDAFVDLFVGFCSKLGVSRRIPCVTELGQAVVSTERGPDDRSRALTEFH